MSNSESIEEWGKLQIDATQAVDDYWRTVGSLHEARDAAIGAAEAAKEKAEKEYEEALAAAKGECVSVIRAAAARRAKKALRPDLMAKVAEQYVAPIETNGSTLDPSFIVNSIEQAEQAREAAEAANAKRAKRQAIIRGLY